MTWKVLPAFLFSGQDLQTWISFFNCLEEFSSETNLGQEISFKTLSLPHWIKKCVV